jgi:hypothetical protein
MGGSGFLSLYPSPFCDGERVGERGGRSLQRHLDESFVRMPPLTLPLCL